jgi:hypothetical protein
MKKTSLVLVFCLAALSMVAQRVPAADQNFPFLVTFGNKAEKSWGDDDFVQIFFFCVPQTSTQPIYIRVFDADAGGKNDENRGGFNTQTKFSVYGGAGAHSNPDARKQDPVGSFKSGVLLKTNTFSQDTAYDNDWYTFGPFSPGEGELQPEFGGYVFKLVIEGISGDDGNLYQLFLSSRRDQNTEMEGGNSFAYEFCFRLPDQVGSISHIYPFVSNNVIAVRINIFDYDKDGMVRIVSVAKKGEMFKAEGDGKWVDTTHPTVADEHNTSLDIQFVKQHAVRNNNIVVYITNQYGELMPFYTVPIGGVPKYRYKIGVKQTK